MKVLIYIAKIYEPQDPQMVNDRSGIALYLHDFAITMAQDIEVYVATYQFSSGKIINNVHYLRHNSFDTIRYNKVLDIKNAVTTFLKTDGNLKNKAKRSFFRLDFSRFDNILDTLQPDIVNLHGVNYEMLRQIEACKKRNIPFLISFHGLIGIDPSVKATPELKNIEKIVFQSADKENWPVTVVSTGVKERAIAFYSLHKKDNISVILNGTKLNEFFLNKQNKKCDELLQEGKKIVVCVGSVSVRKNQEQVVSAWKLLPAEVRKKYVLLIIGADLLQGKLQKRITEEQLGNEIYMLGFLEKAELNYIYKKAALNILASIDEGFGLSIIEAMRFGVPSVIFNDIDAAKDLYNEEVMILVKKRENKFLANAILQGLTKQWDATFIQNFSKRFSMEMVKQEFTGLYNSILR